MGTKRRFSSSSHHARGSRGALSEEDDDDDERRRRRRRRFRRPSSGKSDAREADEPVDTDGGVGRRRRGRCESEEENCDEEKELFWPRGGRWNDDNERDDDEGR